MPGNKFAVASVSLSLDGALEAIQAGIAEATRMGVPLAFVVVDASGLQLAAARMNGAPELALRVAHEKAWTSSQTGAGTGDVYHFIAGDPGSALSMPNVQDFNVVAGGLPIVVDGQRLGALGVSGASPDVDLAAAKAAAAIFS